MDELGERLRRWIREACQHPPGSPERQRRLTQVIRAATEKLWKESSPYYADALQQTWVYFCLNICERGTADPYDPDRSSVITWLNAYLRRRLQDGYIEIQKQQTLFSQPRSLTSRSGEMEVLDPLESVAAQPDVPPILEQVRAWAERDRTGELRKTHIDGHPDVNCQELILRRLPPETSWKDLSAEFGISISTLSSFYQRQCLPRLRNFGESEGYL